MSGLAASALLGACGAGNAEEPAAQSTSIAGQPESPAASSPTPETVAAAAEGLAGPATKKRAERIISTFENSTTQIQYGYVENLDDGRGITVGRSGFTSADGDLLQVMERYNQLHPGSSLCKKYLQALRDVQGTDSVRGLGGFAKAWQEASSTDPDLNRAQDDTYDALYFNPAMAKAQELGVRSAVGQLIILDTFIQHGDSDDKSDPEYYDSFTALAATAGKVQGDEMAWLRRFLNVRRHDLLHPHNKDTAADWADSVDRVEALTSLLDNPSLNPPLRWTVYGDSFTLDA